MFYSFKPSRSMNSNEGTSSNRSKRMHRRTVRLRPSDKENKINCSTYFLFVFVVFLFLGFHARKKSNPMASMSPLNSTFSDGIRFAR